jgi:S-adenosylmethionine decarboxylase
MAIYGKELILDLHECDPSTFTRKSIRKFFQELCELIDMERENLSWWDDYGLPPEECQTEPHLKGTTAVQFIKTSNITIHTLDLLKSVYLNIFSCKDFDPDIVKQFSEAFFKGKIVNNHFIERK